jgi:hypothetical protein
MVNAARGHRLGLVCRATTEDVKPQTTDSATPDAPAPLQPSKRIERTIADLDALLGIQEEAKPAAPPTTAAQPTDAATSAAVPPGTTIDSTLGGVAGPTGAAGPEVEAQLQRLAARARKLAQEQTEGNKEEAQAGLRREFEQLLQSMNNATPSLDKEDIKRLKAEVFGPQTFFVTETLPVTRPDRTGLLVRGNLREERGKVLQHVISKARCWKQ